MMAQVNLEHILHDSGTELPEELLALLDRVREYLPQAETTTIVRAYRGWLSTSTKGRLALLASRTSPTPWQ